MNAKNRAIVTVTVADISSLKWAAQMAEEWKGNRHRDDWEEFEGWIKEVRDAIKKVTSDRKRLRKLEAALLELANG